MSDSPESVSVDARLEALWRDAARSGRPLPGEPSLAATLSISRPAVREALVRLEERGYIHRRKGADTTVNPSLLHIPARFDSRIDTSELISAMGHSPHLDVLEHSIGQISLDEATEHDLAPRTRVLRVTKRWLADGVPVLLAQDSIPLLRGPRGTWDDDAIDALDLSVPMVELAETLTGERGEWEVVWPSADALSAHEASWVSQPVGSPALELHVSGVSRHGGVCYWTRELHLRGAFRYAMVRGATWRQTGTDPHR